jgi:hypothetical protein
MIIVTPKVSHSTMHSPNNLTKCKKKIIKVIKRSIRNTRANINSEKMKNLIMDMKLEIKLGQLLKIVLSLKDLYSRFIKTKKVFLSSMLIKYVY